MTGDLLKCNVLATHTIANVSETLARKLELPERYRSICILTADSDDVTYCALDEATKAAAVEVVYGRSLYAGAANANTKLAGEVICILAGPNPAEVSSGLRAAVEFMDSGVGFRSANEDDSIVYFAIPCPARAPTCPRPPVCGRGRPWPTSSPRPWRRWWAWTRP